MMMELYKEKEIKPLWRRLGLMIVTDYCFSWRSSQDLTGLSNDPQQIVDFSYPTVVQNTSVDERSV
jgi:hypothetical protein